MFTDEELAQFKVNRRAEIKQACYNSIIKGFDTNVKYGVSKHYSLNEFAQKNIDDQMGQLQAGTITNALWHSDDAVTHDVWKATEFSQFYTQKQIFILGERLKSDTLEARLLNASTLEEINSINWDVELTADEATGNQRLINAMYENGTL